MATEDRREANASTEEAGTARPRPFGAQPAVHTLLVGQHAASPAHVADAPVVRWVSEAVGRGQKVLYELEPMEQADAVLRALPVRAGAQLEMVEPATLRALSSGTADGLAQLHRSRVDQARAEGWAGLAIVTGAAVLSAVARPADEPAALHQHGVSGVVVDSGMSALCRYRPAEHPELAEIMFAGHFYALEDEIWSTQLRGDRLCISGSIDISNAGRLHRVLRGALDAGVRVIDLTGLEFCAVAGGRAFVMAAQGLPRGRLVLACHLNPALRSLFSAVGLFGHPAIEVLVEDR